MAFRRQGRTSATSSLLLASNELVGMTEEDLRWQVPAQFAAKGTLDGDRLEGELLPARRHIAAAPLAGDNKLPPFDGWESECHCHSIGEDEANTVWRSCDTEGTIWHGQV